MKQVTSVVLAVVITIARCAIAQLPDQASATGWKIKFAESGSNPVIVDGVLYVGSADGAVSALDPRTGKTKWRFETGESLSSATSGQRALRDWISPPKVITVPRGTSANDQINAAVIAAEKRTGQGIRRVDMTPAVENGTVFIGSGDQSFYAIEAATGKKKWSYVAGAGMASNNNTSYPVPAAVLKNGAVYFVTEEGLHALDALTGKMKWLFETLQELPKQKYVPKKRVPEGPIMGDSVIFLTAWPFIGGNTPQKSFLYAVDPESGKAKWVTSVDGIDITAPTTAKGLAFFAVEEPASSHRVTLYAINAADGQVKWQVGAEKKFGRPRLLIADNTIYFRTDRSVLALELASGHQVWSFSADEINIGAGSLQADDQHLYVATHKDSKDTLHALALTTGQEKWSGSGYFAIVHEGVVYADGEQLLHALDAATGKELWSFKKKARESVRLISEGRSFLTSPTVDYIGTSRVDQGYLYAIDAKAGKLR